MRNTRKSGQILRSKKRPRPTLRSGRGSRTNSNTSHPIPARVIDAVWQRDPMQIDLDIRRGGMLGGVSTPETSVDVPLIVARGAPMRNIPACGSCHGTTDAKLG